MIRSLRPVTTPWLLALVVAASLLGWLPARAAQAANDDAANVERAQEALRSHSTYPWYDKQSDSIRRLEVPPPEKRDSGPRSGSWEAPKFALDQTLLVIALAVAASVLVFLLARAFLRAEDAPAVAASHRTSVVADVQKIEALPFRVDNVSDLLAEARRQYEQGRFDLAMTYLYSHQLLELDRHHLIHLARGKTNRQYLRELPAGSRLRALMSASVVLFEEVFFGRHAVERSRFEPCWASLDEFTQLVGGGAA